VRGVTRRHVGAVDPPLLAFGARVGWAGAERNPLSLASGAREGVGYDEGCQRRERKDNKLLTVSRLRRAWESAVRRKSPRARVWGEGEVHSPRKLGRGQKNCVGEGEENENVEENCVCW
jgi:hypothetical protein